MLSFERVRKFLAEVEREHIIFKQHFDERVQKRPINRGMAVSLLKQTDKLLKVEDEPAKMEGEEKYKIWLKLSNRYSLVLIVAIRQKDLYIITGWNTDTKWQQAIQK